MIIREMTIDDYDEVYEMWQITTKRALSKADERDQMERYLKAQRRYESGCRG